MANNNTLKLIIHGIYAQIVSDSQSLIIRLKNELSQFTNENAEVKRITLTIHFQVVNFYFVTKKWRQVLKNEQFVNATETIFCVTDIVNFSATFFARQNFDLAEAVVLIISQLGYLLRLKLSQDKTVAVFHGAAFCIENNGIILLGNSGAGKTSLSYLLCQQGFNYLSDEDSFVIHHGDFSILGFQRHLRLPEYVVDLIEVDSSNWEQYHGFGDSGFIYDTQPHIPNSNRAQLKAIVIVNNHQNLKKITLDLLEKSKRLELLLKHWESAETICKDTVSQQLIINYNRQSFEMMKNMVQHFPIYCLNYAFASHYAQIPQMMKAMLCS